MLLERHLFVILYILLPVLSCTKRAFHIYIDLIHSRAYCVEQYYLYNPVTVWCDVNIISLRVIVQSVGTAETIFIRANPDTVATWQSTPGPMQIGADIVCDMISMNEFNWMYL